MHYCLPIVPLLTSRVSQAVVVMSVALGAMVVLLAAGIALLAPTVLGIVVLIVLVRRLARADDPDAHRRLLRWTLVAFVTHLAFGLVVTNVGGFVEAYLRAPDSSVYHADAVRMVHHWTEGLPGPDLPAGKEGFYYLLAGLYWLFGSHPAAGLAVNATLAAALVPLITETTGRLFGDDAARPVAPLVALLPGPFMWTSQLLKEAPILFLIAVAAMCAVRVVGRMQLSSLLGLAVSLALLFTLRAWVGLVVAGGLLTGIMLGRRHLASGLATGMAAVSLVVALVALGLGAPGYRAAVNSDLAQANIVRKDLATAGSGFDAEVDVSTSSRALSYLPRGLLTLVFGPFPWQIRSARQLPVLPDVVVWWLLFPSLVRGLRAAGRVSGRAVLVVLLPAVTTAALLALTVGNFGTVVRERGQVTVLLLPLIALGLSRRDRSRSAGGGDPEVKTAQLQPALLA